jgi:hypothetical protein
VTEGVTELSRSLTGTVIGPEDAEYDAARRPTLVTPAADAIAALLH